MCQKQLGSPFFKSPGFYQVWAQNIQISENFYTLPSSISGDGQECEEWKGDAFSLTGCTSGFAEGRFQ